MSSARNLLFGLSSIAAAVLAPIPAHASEVFPGAIQEAAGLSCAPSCLLCHTSNPGSITTYMGKPFGAAMAKNGAAPQNTASLKEAYTKYAADTANATGVNRLMSGLDPDYGSPLCDLPTYGCGAHVAKEAPPKDFSAPLWVIGAVVAGGLLRRGRKSFVD
jgi:hypothetical protein